MVLRLLRSQILSKLKSAIPIVDVAWDSSAMHDLIRVCQLVACPLAGPGSIADHQPDSPFPIADCTFWMKFCNAIKRDILQALVRRAETVLAFDIGGVNLMHWVAPMVARQLQYGTSVGDPIPWGDFKIRDEQLKKLKELVKTKEYTSDLTQWFSLAPNLL